MKIRLVVVGSGVFGLPSFERLRSWADVEIPVVITQPDRPSGRKGLHRPTPVSLWARDHRLPILTPASLRQNPDIEKTLRDIRPDILLVADYGLILPSVVLSIPSHAGLNIHGSLLPRYRGAAPIAYAIWRGDPTTGVTFMQMDQGIDTGPIVAQYTVPIEPTDTAPVLEDRLARLAGQHVRTVVKGFVEDHHRPQTQPSALATTAPKLSVGAGQADWVSAAELTRRLRAFQPWPGLWSIWRGRRIKFLAATAQSIQPTSPAGTIVSLVGGWGVACREGVFRPSQVQFEGRQPQPASTIPGGYPGFIGGRFDS